MASRARTAAFAIVVVVVAAGVALSWHNVHPSTVAAVVAVATVVATVVGVALLPGRAPGARSPVRHSARVTAVIMIACMALTAFAVPVALHLPRWLAVEAVLGGWWLGWATVLSVHAYKERPFDADESQVWLDDEARASTEHRATFGSDKTSSAWNLLDLAGADEIGSVITLVFILAVVTLIGVWLVVEVVAPALFLATYLGLTHALDRARTSRHRGQAGRSVVHGAIWATAYVAPLAALVALGHASAR